MRLHCKQKPMTRSIHDRHTRKITLKQHYLEINTSLQSLCSDRGAARGFSHYTTMLQQYLRTKQTELTQRGALLYPVQTNASPQISSFLRRVSNSPLCNSSPREREHCLRQRRYLSELQCLRVSRLRLSMCGDDDNKMHKRGR